MLRAAAVAQAKAKALSPLRQWAVTVQGRSSHNRAACALADKLARICYAALRDHEPFDERTPRLSKKVSRQAFAMPA